MTLQFVYDSLVCVKTALFRRFFSNISKANKNLAGTMVIQHHVKGYDEFTKKMEELENSKETIHVLFSGGKDETGNSWCPYCVTAEPIVMDNLKNVSEQSHFIHVDVGERAYWKDLNCPFRKDPRTHLVFLPTLLRWKSPQRLDGERVTKPDLVEMLLSDE